MAKISLATIQGALKSPKTPANLKRGLIKKYGHLLSGKQSMSTLTTTMQSNPKKRAKKSKGNVQGTHAPRRYLAPGQARAMAELSHMAQKKKKKKKKKLSKKALSQLRFIRFADSFAKNPAKRMLFPKNHTHTQRFNNVAQYWNKLSWKDRNALVMLARITDHYKGYYNLQDPFIGLPQAMRGALIIHLYKLR